MDKERNIDQEGHTKNEEKAAITLLELARDRKKEQLDVHRVHMAKVTLLLAGVFFLLIRDNTSLPEAIISIFDRNQPYLGALFLIALISMYICLIISGYFGHKAISIKEYDIPNPEMQEDYLRDRVYKRGILKVVKNMNESCDKIDEIQNQAAESITTGTIFLVIALIIRIVLLFTIPAFAP